MLKYCCVLLSLMLSVTFAQADEPAADGMTGLKVGEKAPEFSLLDQNGTRRSLSAILKDGKVAIVFYSSASW